MQINRPFLTYDGHGLNGNDQYGTRVLTFAKGQDGAYLLDADQRKECASKITDAVNSHAQLVAALVEVDKYFDSVWPNMNFGIPPQVKAALALARGGVKG